MWKCPFTVRVIYKGNTVCLKHTWTAKRIVFLWSLENRKERRKQEGKFRRKHDISEIEITENEPVTTRSKFMAKHQSQGQCLKNETNYIRSLSIELRTTANQDEQMTPRGGIMSKKLLDLKLTPDFKWTSYFRSIAKDVRKNVGSLYLSSKYLTPRNTRYT